MTETQIIDLSFFNVPADQEITRPAGWPTRVANWPHFRCLDDFPKAFLHGGLVESSLIPMNKIKLDQVSVTLDIIPFLSDDLNAMLEVRALFVIGIG
ncbi:unnamed protein product [Amaranthus hypochondriacus]